MGTRYSLAMQNHPRYFSPRCAAHTSPLHSTYRTYVCTLVVSYRRDTIFPRQTVRYFNWTVNGWRFFDLCHYTERWYISRGIEGNLSFEAVPRSLPANWQHIRDTLRYRSLIENTSAPVAYVRKGNSWRNPVLFARSTVNNEDWRIPTIDVKTLLPTRLLSGIKITPPRIRSRSISYGGSLLQTVEHFPSSQLFSTQRFLTSWDVALKNWLLR